ncbi:MAG: transporter [Betaproteobacteria bacterium]|nr:transporter [Betaproteobacteria bacterium]
MKRLLILSLAALLAGCSLFPKYQRPEVKTPAEFRGQTAPLDSKSLADLAWSDLYRDPVLETLIRTALEQNYDVRIALARIEEFRGAAGISGLGSIPQISAGGSAERSRITTVGPTPLPSTSAPVRNTYNAEVDVSYEVDLWRRIANLNVATRADLIASEFARDAVRVSVVANVASAYFALRALDQQLAITVRTVESRAKFVEMTRAQFERGVVSGLDVNRAEASLATARSVVPDLKAQIAQTENLLEILLGQNPAPIVRAEAADKFFPAPVEVPTGLPAALLERRPDLRQAENTLIGANARLKSIKASLYPTISLTGSFGSQSAALSNLFTGPARIWSFGLGVLQPIIDVNRNKYQVEIYTARERQAILQYQQAVAQAFREVSDALAARQGFTDRLTAQDEQVAALRSAREQVGRRYNIGFSSYFEVIDADTALFNAELTRIAAYQNSLNALVQLYKALGGGWQIEADERAGVAGAGGTPQAAPAPAK